MYLPWAFHYVYQTNGVLGGFEGEDVKVLCSDPQKALPCVNRRLLLYRMSKSLQRFKLQVQGMILHTNKEIKKLSDNFGYMGK